MSSSLTFGPDNGTFTLRTGVAGTASRAGHRLTIGFSSWSAAVAMDDDSPASVELTVDVDSLEVRSGDGGLTPMTPPERAVARLNALKSLKASKFPRISFVASDVSATADGYRLDGDLTICGTSRPHSVDVVVDGSTVSSESSVKQIDFGVKPYSLMMGALKVADEVVIAVEVATPYA